LRKVRGVDLLLVFIPPGSELMQAKARRELDDPLLVLLIVYN